MLEYAQFFKNMRGSVKPHRRLKYGPISMQVENENLAISVNSHSYSEGQYRGKTLRVSQRESVETTRQTPKHNDLFRMMI
jgi:hypothetical protein